MTSYTQTEATQKLNSFGFVVQSWPLEGERRKVSLHVAYKPTGEEYIQIRIAHGKWKGNSIGAAWRS